MNERLLIFIILLSLWAVKKVGPEGMSLVFQKEKACQLPSMAVDPPLAECFWKAIGRCRTVGTPQVFTLTDWSKLGSARKIRGWLQKTDGLVYGAVNSASPAFGVERETGHGNRLNEMFRRRKGRDVVVFPLGLQTKISAECDAISPSQVPSPRTGEPNRGIPDLCLHFEASRGSTARQYFM